MNIKKPEYKLSEETAEEQICSLLDYYEIDVDELPSKQKDAIESVLARLVKSVRLGRLEINVENGISCIQTLRDGKTQITYREINGKAKIAMGTKKDGDQNGRVYAVMGALSEGEEVISRLKGVDLSLVENLGMVFLLV